MNTRKGAFETFLEKKIFSKVRYALLKISYTLKALSNYGVGYIIRYYGKQKISNLLHLILISEWVNIFSNIPNSDEEFYNYWLLKNFPREADLRVYRRSIEALEYKPIVSFIFWGLESLKPDFKEAIESILTQIYPFWEIILVSDDSFLLDDYEFIKHLKNAYSDQIKFIINSNHRDVVDELNYALEATSGELVSFLRPDGVLSPDALYQVVLEYKQQPDCIFIYSDEDCLDKNGYLKKPFFKPDWCPDSFLSRFYTGQLSLYSRKAISDVGGLRRNFKEQAIFYDLVLRLSELEGSIAHLPYVLYHRYSSFQLNKATQIDQKGILSTLEEAIIRRDQPGHVEINSNGFSLVRYNIASHEKATIIIPTKDLGNILDRCLASIFEKTHYSDFEVCVVDNGSKDSKTLEIIDAWKEKQPGNVHSLRLDIPFNFSYLNNEAVRQTSSKYLLFLNNDTEVISAGWLTAMIEQAQRPSIGAVGAMLLYPDSTIQHAGVLIGLGGVAGHCFQHYPVDYEGYFGQAQSTSNYSAVTAACLMCRREVFEEVGGFNNELAAAYNDIDLCLNMVEKGYKNIYLSHVKLFHYESKSRGYDLSPQKVKAFSGEADYMQKRWAKYIAKDPCYNPNLPKRFNEHRKVYI